MLEGAYESLRKRGEPRAGARVLVVLLSLVVSVAMICAWATIVRRNGYSRHWLWGLIGVVIPLLNIAVALFYLVVFFMFAFRESPVEKELRQLRTQLDIDPSLPPGAGLKDQYGQYPPGGGHPQQHIPPSSPYQQHPRLGTSPPNLSPGLDPRQRF